MKTKQVTAFAVTGIATRTCNQDEMNPETAKIARLWQTFSTQVASKLSETSKVYGIYTNYESDHQGYYDIIAGSDTLTSDMLGDIEDDVASMQSHQIASGNYLSFTATGSIPEAAILLWQEIWQYFEQPDCPHQRAYTTDFEFYKSENDIEIYIAIK